MPVTCEVAPHHWTLTDDELAEYDTNTKMSPPLRSRDHVAALLEGLRDGTIDAIATDHAPHHADEKELEFDEAPFGITGLETAVGLAFELVNQGVIDLAATGVVVFDQSGPDLWFERAGKSRGKLSCRHHHSRSGLRMGF